MECPVCQEPMEEITAYVTECCSAEPEEGSSECPACGEENPIVVEGEPVFTCDSCGYKET